MTRWCETAEHDRDKFCPDPETQRLIDWVLDKVQHGSRIAAVSESTRGRTGRIEWFDAAEKPA